jgi:hypothetical protein
MTHRDTVRHILDQVGAALPPFVLAAFRGAYGNRYLIAIEKALESKAYKPRFPDEEAALRELDTQNWLNLLMRRWDEVCKLQYEEINRSYIGELLQARHAWAHEKPMTLEQAYRTADTAYLLLGGFGLTGAQAQVAPIRAALLRQLHPEMAPASSDALADMPATAAPVRQAAPPMPVPPPLAADDAELDRIAGTWTPVQVQAEAIRLLRQVCRPTPPISALHIAPRSLAHLRPQHGALIILPPEAYFAPDGESPALRALSTYDADGTFAALDGASAREVGRALRRWLAAADLAFRSNENPNLELLPQYDQAVERLLSGYAWLLLRQHRALRVERLPDDGDPVTRAAHWLVNLTERERDQLSRNTS